MNKNKEELFNILLQVSKDKKIFISFLDDILTKKELKNLTTRWQIIKKLYKKENHHIIANDLKIGVGTVTRGSRELQDKNGGFYQAIKKFKLIK
jgi:Trp operon repressor